MAYYKQPAFLALLLSAVTILAPTATAQFDSYLPKFTVPDAAHRLSPKDSENFIVSKIQSALPDFLVNSLLSLDDKEIEEKIRHHLNAISSPRCVEDLVASATLLSASLNSSDVTTPTWLLHMIDAWGKFPSGLLSGNVASPGDFSECLQLRAAYTSLPSLKINEFQGSYCSVMLVPVETAANETLAAAWSHKMSRRTSQRRAASLEEFIELLAREDWVPIIPFLGTCLPSTCTYEDQQYILETAIMPLTSGLLYPYAVDCQTDEQTPFQLKQQAMIAVLGLIGSLCFIGTVYDLLIIRRKPKDQVKTTGLSKGDKLMQAFSVYENGTKILSTDAGSRSLGCINGLRFISMAWVICGHTFLAGMYQHSANLIDVKNNHEYGWLIMVVLNATPSVDTFFVMSGLLVAYNLLRELDKTKGFREFVSNKVPLMYIQRYLRLTPTYLILIGIVATIYPFAASSPLWYFVKNEAQLCSEKWWHNILYINSIVDSGDGKAMCFGESWYIANDMIFFILSPLLVYPLWRWPVVGLALMAIATAATTFANFYIIGIYDIPPTTIVSMINVEFDYLIYQRPWTRCGPYIIGMFVGYLLYTYPKPEELRPTKIVNAVGWSASTILALLIIFGPYEFFKPENKEITLHSFRALLFGGLSRLTWGCVIGWIIFACVKGQGGIVNRILCYEAFVPLSRLSYCAYIASFHLQLIYHLVLMVPVIYNPYFMFHAFFAHMVFTMIVSFGLTVTMESPFMNLVKLMFSK